jgi:hypothetical protein
LWTKGAQLSAKIRGQNPVKLFEPPMGQPASGDGDLSFAVDED